MKKPRIKPVIELSRDGVMRGFLALIRRILVFDQFRVVRFLTCFNCDQVHAIAMS